MTMPRTLWLAVTVAAVAVARAQVPNLGWCPNVDSKSDMDFDEMLGSWYEAERLASLLEAGSRCVKTTYTKGKDGRYFVSNEYVNSLTGVKRLLEGEIRSITKGIDSTINVKYTSLACA